MREVRAGVKARAVRVNTDRSIGVQGIGSWASVTWCSRSNDLDRHVMGLSTSTACPVMCELSGGCAKLEMYWPAGRVR